MPLSDPWQMSNLTSHFYACLDSRDYAGVLGCFAEEGEWFRRGSSVRGTAAITKALANRPANFHTAHVVTNVRVHLTSESEGYVLFYLTGHPHTGDVPEGEHVALPEAHMLTEYRDSMRNVEGRWVITEKRPLRTMYQSHAKLP